MSKFLSILFLLAAASAQVTVVGRTSATAHTQIGALPGQAATLVSIITTCIPAKQTVNLNSACNAVGTFDDDSQQDVTTTSTWASSNIVVATIGVRTATQAVGCITAGTAVISATVGTIVGNFTLTCINPPNISTTSIPAGTVNQNYGPIQLSATGGTLPYTWSCTSGCTGLTIAPGVSLSTTGSISGLPTVFANYPFTAQVCDAVLSCDTQALTLVINSASNTFDAVLPQNWVDTHQCDAAINSPDVTKTVKTAGGDYTCSAGAMSVLQTALNDAETDRVANNHSWLIKVSPACATFMTVGSSSQLTYKNLDNAGTYVYDPKQGGKCIVVDSFTPLRRGVRIGSIALSAIDRNVSNDCGAHTTNRVCVTTLDAHGLNPGDLVMIDGVTGMTAVNTSPNQPWTVLATPDSTHFTFAQTGPLPNITGTVTFPFTTMSGPNTLSQQEPSLWRLSNSGGNAYPIVGAVNATTQKGPQSYLFKDVEVFSTPTTNNLTSISRDSSGLVTLVMNAANNGVMDFITIAGVTPSSFNGYVHATKVTTTKLTYSQPGLGAATGSGGNITFSPQTDEGLIVLGPGATSTTQIPYHLGVEQSYIHGCAGTTVPTTLVSLPSPIPCTGPEGHNKSGIRLFCSDCWTADNFIDQINYEGIETHSIGAGPAGIGPEKIINNRLRGGSTTIHYGGAAPNILHNNPVDLEIAQNTVDLDPNWQAMSFGGGKSTGGTAGDIHGWLLKNRIEFKTGDRVVVWGNKFYWTWTDGDQAGSMFLLTPRAYDGGEYVRNVTIENNFFQHTWGFLQITGRSDLPGTGVGLLSGQFRVRNNVISDVGNVNLLSGVGALRTFPMGGGAWLYTCSASRSSNVATLSGCTSTSTPTQTTLSTEAGDWIHTSACTDATFNTTNSPAISVNPFSLGPLTYANAGPNVSGVTCTFSNDVGMPRGLRFNHNTVISAGSPNDRESFLSITATARYLAAKNNLWVASTVAANAIFGALCTPGGGALLDGTASTQSFGCLDSATAEFHHNGFFIPSNPLVQTKYSDWNPRGTENTAHPTTFFGTSLTCSGVFTAACPGFLADFASGTNANDPHDYQLNNSSVYAAGNANAADDGKDLGADFSELDSTFTQDPYPCQTDCTQGGTVHGPYPLIAAGLTLNAITVGFSQGTIQAGNTATATGSGNYSDGSQADVTNTCTWASSDVTKATVSGSGNPRTITGVAAGTSNITCTIGAVIGTATITVTAGAPTLSTITVIPATKTVTFGQTSTVNYTATGNYSDGSQQDVTSSCAPWASSNAGVATVAGSGNPRVVTIVAAGSANITCTITAIVGTGALTVNSAGTGTVTVSPASLTIPQGSALPMLCWTTTTAKPACSWSLISGAGTLTTNGNYIAPGSGTTATIRATVGANHADATITVSGTMLAVTGNYSVTTSAFGGAGNVLHMLHNEDNGTIGGGPPINVNRNFDVIKPANYVACNATYSNNCSPMVVLLGETAHGIAQPSFTSGWCRTDTAFNEVAGDAPFILTMPSPAPVLVCIEPYHSNVGDPSGPYIWNGWGARHASATWDNNVIPRDHDLLQQIIMRVQADLKTDPRQVYLRDHWYHGAEFIESAAINNWPYIAAFAAYNDVFPESTDSTRTVKQGAWTGTVIPTSANGPISAILMNGLTGTRSNLQLYSLCGNNLPNTDQLVHSLNWDFVQTFWDNTDNFSNTTRDPSGVGSSWCTSTAFSTGWLKPSALRHSKSTGGNAGTELEMFNIAPSGFRGPPYCSFGWGEGASTIPCDTSIGNAQNLCTNAGVNPPPVPYNLYINGTGGANCNTSTVPNDELNTMYKFLLAHPKP